MNHRDELQEAISEARDAFRGLNFGRDNRVDINITAGGWITFLACAVATMCLMLQWQSQLRQMGIDAKQDADTRELRAEQRGYGDYQNMLWRAYPELRESALQAHEERDNGKPDRN